MASSAPPPARSHSLSQRRFILCHFSGGKKELGGVAARKRGEDGGGPREYIFHCERRFYWPFYGTNKRPRYADLHTACFVIHRLPFARHPPSSSSLSFSLFLPSSRLSSLLLFSSFLRLPSSSSLLGLRREVDNHYSSKDRFSPLCRNRTAKSASRSRFRKYLHFSRRSFCQKQKMRCFLRSIRFDLVLMGDVKSRSTMSTVRLLLKTAFWKVYTVFK